MWLRRSFAIFLCIVLILPLVASVALMVVDHTLLRPQFASEQLAKADVYNFAYDEVLPLTLEEAASSNDSPLDLNAIAPDIISVTKKAMPPDWLRLNFERLVTTVYPYLLGDTEDFSYTLVLKDRADIAFAAIKEDLLSGDSSAEIYKAFTTYVSDTILEGAEAYFPGVNLTETEVEDWLKETIPQAWFISQLKSALDEVQPYLEGESEQFLVQISLDAITDEALLRLIGEENAGYLDEARQLVESSLTFTETDLEGYLDEDQNALLQNVRLWIKDGYTLTEEELTDALVQTPEDLSALNETRHGLKTTRSWLWVSWLLPVLLLTAIAFLGGKSLRGRILWTVLPLLIVSLALYFAIGLVDGNNLSLILREVLNFSPSQGVESAVAVKVTEIADNTATDLVNSFRTSMAGLAVLSGLALLGTIAWSITSGRKKQTNRNQKKTRKR